MNLVDAIDINKGDPDFEEVKEILWENGSYGLAVTAANIVAWHRNQIELQNQNLWKRFLSNLGRRFRDPCL